MYDPANHGYQWLIISTTLLIPIFCLDMCQYDCFGKVNTLCKYASPIPSGACGESIRTGLSELEKNLILEAHNQFRRTAALGVGLFYKTGNKAVRMYELAWNNDLALTAQRWALQCIWDHDECRRTKDFQYVGQNLARMKHSVDGNIVQMIRWWADEGDMIGYGNQYYSTLTKIGHYTQMLWDNTSYIGCGYHVSKKDGIISSLLACNYGPAGNWRNSAFTFRTGEVCEECVYPDECVSGLCRITPDSPLYIPDSSSHVSESATVLWLSLTVVLCISRIQNGS